MTENIIDYNVGYAVIYPTLTKNNIKERNKRIKDAKKEEKRLLEKYGSEDFWRVTKEFLNK